MRTESNLREWISFSATVLCAIIFFLAGQARLTNPWTPWLHQEQRSKAIKEGQSEQATRSVGYANLLVVGLLAFAPTRSIGAILALALLCWIVSQVTGEIEHFVPFGNHGLHMLDLSVSLGRR
jgi:hypothetical protein